ncbi:MAG: RagB/SusD family nutrient uptake outer membrane protein, partial [Segatella oris]
EDWKYTDGFQDTYTSYLNYQYEVRCLRAFYYFELVRRYGNIPLITKTLTKEEAKKAEPVSAENVLRFVIDECTDVAQHLPAKTTTLPGGAANMQRVSKGVALALKSRATLYLASPLFNTSGDVAKWEAAATAAFDVISQASAFGYALDNDYKNLFGATNNQSAEVILCCPEGKTTHFEAANYPIGVEKGSGYTCPTENLVSAYEMSDGSSFDWNNPAQAANPYKNRDPRLEMTVVFNGMQWPAKIPVETYHGGRNGQPLLNATTTGYYLKKYLNNKVIFEAGKNTNSFDHNWILFRYAEILLNYAEAMAEAYGPDQVVSPFTMTAREAVNLVRSRKNVKMPDFPTGMSKADFLARLRNERRVELAFEGHRFWDLRRWKALDEMKDIYKVNIEKQADGTLTFTKEKLSTYDITDKMYFYPISNAERYKNTNLKQNPGWGE